MLTRCLALVAISCFAAALCLAGLPLVAVAMSPTATAIVLVSGWQDDDSDDE